jgi:hypothetical protein
MASSVGVFSGLSLVELESPRSLNVFNSFLYSAVGSKAISRFSADIIFYDISTHSGSSGAGIFNEHGHLFGLSLSINYLTR